MTHVHNVNLIYMHFDIGVETYGMSYIQSEIYTVYLTFISTATRFDKNYIDIVSCTQTLQLTRLLLRYAGTEIYHCFS